MVAWVSVFFCEVIVHKKNEPNWTRGQTEKYNCLESYFVLATFENLLSKYHDPQLVFP
jgi:hypothetical protein